VGRLLAVPALIAAALAATPPAEAARPWRIPALREWTDAAGSYTFGTGSRIVLNSTHASALATTASVFANDLYQLTGRSVTVATGSPATGDIYLTLGSSDTAIGDESYPLTIGASMRVEANSPKLVSRYNQFKSIITAIGHAPGYGEHLGP
jgi:hexosaminidase